jgi:hypothetical protein
MPTIPRLSCCTATSDQAAVVPTVVNIASDASAAPPATGPDAAIVTAAGLNTGKSTIPWALIAIGAKILFF